jgi:hypothetical protein
MSGRENHQKAITRVGQWLDLTDEERRKFINLAHDSFGVEDIDFTDYNEQYLEFLEQNVFTNEEVLNYLRKAGIESDTLELFETKSVPFDEVYKSWNEIRYSTNEILDLTMLLKLIDEYSRQSEEGLVNSRFKLQKLVYLVNRELVEQERTGPETRPVDHGKLEATGFRYTYRKRESGPFSKNLQEDKHRLYASNLIDEGLIKGESTPEVNENNRRFKISLGGSGEVMMERFSGLLQNLSTDVLSEWENAITTVVGEYSSMSIQELYDHVSSIDDVSEADDREVLIRGRQVEYDSEPWLEVSTERGVSYV